ncbi:MAG: FimB/Mfa2 family fimbrial subunit [Muribaculaceae bacterium]|nr:FimB/Mfa2 family fimbrial subunit [Muribaculaceae bacterium]
MNSTTFTDSIKKYTAVVALMGGMLLSASCDRLHEDLQPCPQGVRLRFIYDYNMEYANAFPSQVDCLTVLFYDEEGKYVTTRSNIPSEDLSNEEWRMTVDLEPGAYNIIAYGGMDCADSSFSFTSSPASVGMEQLQVELNHSNLTQPKGTRLHNLFYGRLDVEVDESDTNYRDYTLYMMKDTNNLRVMLQQVDGTNIDEKDFEFKVVDDNTLMAWNNDIIPTGNVEYYPWASGNVSPGELGDGGTASVAYAEMSFGRLVTTNSPRLIVTRKADGYTVINIPLNNYLLLMKSDLYNKMPAQEFLDRESRWKMLFFLQGGIWLKTTIEVNDWTVRLNNTEFGL